jgi:hypothetical protein
MKFFPGIFLAGMLSLGSMANSLQAAPTPVRLENGSILYAELSKTVDAGKAKVGDPVMAVLLADILSHGKIVIRHDSKLVGHVTEVRPHSKEVPESRLGIVFDKVILKDGEVLFQSLLLAIRPAERPAFDVPAPPPPRRGSAVSPMQDNRSPQGADGTPPTGSPLGAEVHSHDRELAGTGPTDIDGLSLSSLAGGSAGTIVSTQRTVKLESGVRIELRVTAPGQ